MFSLIQAAGWPVWFLIAASIAAVALIIERSLSLRRDKVLPPKLLDDVLMMHRSGQIDTELIQRLESSSPIGRVFASGLRQEQAPRDVMKEAMEETGRGVAHDLERFLPALGTIAAVAPLMGLFGTVVGMIEIFGAQAPSGTNPQQLAHGISVALYNTAFALVIAIPALIAYRHFRTRVDSYLVEMEQQSLRLIDTIRLARPAGAPGAVGTAAAGVPFDAAGHPAAGAAAMGGPAAGGPAAGSSGSPARAAGAAASAGAAAPRPAQRTRPAPVRTEATARGGKP